jgi:hypothetical protein
VLPGELVVLGHGDEFSDGEGEGGI